MKKIIFTLFLLSASISSFAGWPLGKGRASIVLTYTYFYSNKYYDKNGKLQNPVYDGDYFKSNSVALYFAYGLGRRLDFFATAPYIIQELKSNGNIDTRSDFGDAMIGLSYSIPNKNYSSHLSIAPAFIYPLYSNAGNTLLMGYESMGADLTLNYGASPKWFKSKGFYMLEAGYRRYFQEDGPEQIHYSAKLGLIYKKYNQFIFELSGMHSNSITTNANVLNPFINKSFSFGKGIFTYGRKIRRTTTLYVNGYYTLYGRSTGKGYGFGAALMVRLP